ncbi:MAG: hybrid sensor histidine kinase/response regulator, partial [Planctomycetota bacterium]
PGGLDEEAFREIFEDFVAETREKIPESRKALKGLGGEAPDREDADRLFRFMHTVKGTARFLKLAALAELAGLCEARLEVFRTAGPPFPEGAASLLGQSLEQVEAYLVEAEEGRVSEAVPALTAPLAPPPGEEPKAEARPVEAVEPPPKTRREPARVRESPSEGTIRVDTRRLDELMNLTGEMVLGRNRLLQALHDVEDRKDLDAALASLTDTADFIDMVTSDLQKAVIKTRMQPVGRIFNKFPRMVRDLSREKKKSVALEIQGADTELDKSVIDEINDPLVHLIRNAVDHGIEPPSERPGAGKSETGKIVLAARQEGNRIAIEVADDGRGLDPEKIRGKIVEKGLMGEGEARGLPEGEVLNLIFLPGFSTAETVGRTSGRGVGMDVVRSNIEKLGGFVELDSRPGEGTRFVVKLPLTLAIIPVLMVRVREEIFALPAVSVIETVRLHPEELKTIDGKEVINLRGKILPILRLSDLFRLDGREGGARRRYVVVAGLAEKRVGLLVNGLIGQEEVVIKPLGDLFEHAAGIAGATIRGDGRVALILDFSSLLKLSPAPAPAVRRVPAAEKPRPPAPEPAPRADRKVLTVLVVDDSATERKIVRKAVEVTGHRVFEASDGASALAKLKERDFDIVITDIEMEGMDGLALAERIRTNASWKALPVVALSTHGMMVDRIRGSEAGLDAYLVKPLDPADLERTFKRFFGG